MVCPESKEVVLPSYFRGIPITTYEDTRKDGNQLAAVGVAVNKVAERLADFDPSTYFASLPAAGLSFGYFENFVRPARDVFAAGANSKLSKEVERDGKRNFTAFDPPTRFTIYVVVPPRPINRDSVQELFKATDYDGTIDLGTLLREVDPRVKRRKMEFEKYQLNLADGRDISIYASISATPESRFMVFDVPTTLMTTITAIEKVSKSWGESDKAFEERLTEREAVNFRRAITNVVRERGLATNVKVVGMEEFEQMAFDQS